MSTCSSCPSVPNVTADAVSMKIQQFNNIFVCIHNIIIDNICLSCIDLLQNLFLHAVHEYNILKTSKIR